MLWAALGCFGLLWAALGCSGLLWDALGWAALGCSGLLEAALGGSELLWADFEQDKRRQESPTRAKQGPRGAQAASPELRGKPSELSAEVSNDPRGVSGSVGGDFERSGFQRAIAQEDPDALSGRNPLSVDQI